jgi:hypothetical protein
MMEHVAFPAANKAVRAAMTLTARNELAGEI